MRPGAAWLAGLTLYALAGAPIAVHASLRRISAAGLLSVAAACGMVVSSFLMTVWALAGWHWSVPTILTAAFATCMLLRLAIPGRRRDAVTLSRAPRTATESCARLLLAVSVASVLAATASASASSPDLLFFWGAKAQAFASARTIDATFLGAPTLGYLHISYPPLVTNVYALATMIAGRFAWGAATLTFPLLLALLAAALPSFLSLAGSRKTAVASAALALSIIAYLGSSLGIAGSAEMPLIFFETLAAALLVGSWSLEPGGQLIAGLVLAGAVSAKVEGLPFSLSSALLFLWFRRRELRWPSAALRLLAPSVLCVGAWFSYGASKRLFLGYEGYGRILDVHWNHVSLVASGIARSAWSEGWSLPFTLPFLTLVLGSGRRRLAWIPLGTAAALAGFFFFTYLHGDGDPSLWISWSAGRIFIPVAVLLAIAATARSAQTRVSQGSLEDQ